MLEAAEIVDELIGGAESFAQVDTSGSLIFLPVDNGRNRRPGLVVMHSSHEDPEPAEAPTAQSSTLSGRSTSASSQVQQIAQDPVFQAAVNGLRNPHRISVSNFLRQMRAARQVS